MPESEPDQPRPDPSHPPDPALAAEQQHLADSRAALARMRAHTAGLTAVGGDRVSTEHLKQVLWRRMQALEDDPTVPLFFGRLDYDPALGAERAERLYIGRRHVTGEAGGEPLVIDWRAPVSLPFYRATATEPMTVALRRRFGFSTGRLTAYEDEDLAHGEGTAPSEGPGTASEILAAEIERPRTGPMRDIVATIQPEQDSIVRADLATSICVQGAPGTGKTAVGLHRAAYLLYAYREQLSRSGVLVVGPNDSFLSYIGDVLPALGEIDATQATVASMITKATGAEVRGLDEVGAALVKGDARMAEVIRRAVWDGVREPTEPLVVPRGAHQWRVPTYLAAEIVAELRGRGIRYAAARDMLPQRLAHQVLLRMEAAGDSPDDRVQNAVARSKPVKSWVDAVWPALDPAKVILRLLTEPAFLATHAEGVLDPDEQRMIMMRKPARSARAARWSLADVVLIDEALDQLHRTPSLGHVILDEAQDLSAMQLRAVGRRASTGSVTVLGDLAQATTPWATRSWAESLQHLGQSGAHVEELVAGFRVPAAVIEFAARLLPTIAPSLTPPYAIRRSRGDLVLREGRPEDELVTSARLALDREGSIGVIVPDARLDWARRVLDGAGIGYGVLGEQTDPLDEEVFRTRLDLVPASIAKGLEFDHVVVVEPAAVVAGEADTVTGLRRLYVCLTRAVTSLQVVHQEPLPVQLAA
ncbi:DNA helicase IV [Friedmanniella endophytica]|uniref:DNA helicase IV n=1 Tax=Microlunatus kandeliicorticis TaxID=1759536 RepID=A0A7W3IT53_9ACTN|nr:AAA family ATPase [Microlunatus kandeliicorticis]MBA8794695.1 DNA helicase IV [Microlunatus kandeliicorticis]